MSTSATIVELNRFRRIRDALSAIVSPEPAEKTEPRVDWYLPGFTGKSRVTTIFGELPIEALRVRDDLRTYSGVAARVEVVDQIHLDADFLRGNQSAFPIRIPANAFGAGRPTQDMIVSPGQEICSDAHVVSHFLKARDLRGRFGQDLVPTSGLTYYRFHCGAPTIVRIDGIWVRVQP